MFSKIKDEYREATEHASINTHHRILMNKEGYKLGIFNLFLLTTLGLMGYVGFDSLKEKSNFFENTDMLNVDNESIEILGILDINHLALESEKKLISVASEIDNLVNSSTLEDNSIYTQALSREIHKEHK